LEEKLVVGDVQDNVSDGVGQVRVGVLLFGVEELQVRKEVVHVRGVLGLQKVAIFEGFRQSAVDVRLLGI
jgi:hypothetical protein